MRMSLEEKTRSHARIVASAARLARMHGVEGASVADVMRDAAMTHGGFYKHFASKDAMLEAALDHAFTETAQRLDPDLAPAEAAARSAAFLSFYLSDLHLRTPEHGCPIATLGIDVARGTASLKQRFGAGVRRIIGLLARGTTGSDHTRRARATRDLALMVGAAIIARASDPETAALVLAACRVKTGNQPAPADPEPISSAG